MIEVGQTLVHEDIASQQFVCNLNHCKGACCIEGDSGAPLLESELNILDEIYPQVKPYMTAKGIEAVESYGTSVKDFEGGFNFIGGKKFNTERLSQLERRNIGALLNRFG